MAYSEDPDQTPHSAASDQVLHGLLRLSVQILGINTVFMEFSISLRFHENKYFNSFIVMKI